MCKNALPVDHFVLIALRDAEQLLRDREIYFIDTSKCVAVSTAEPKGE